MKGNPNPKNVISISQIGTIVAQVRKNEWYASQNIFLLTPKEENEILLSFFGVGAVDVSLTRTFSDGYSNYPTLSKLNDLKISLPIKNGEIDFDFMESFIAEVEAEKIARVKKYLSENNLENCTLTAEEKQILEDFENEKIEWNEFNVVDIFTVKNSGNILARDIEKNSGDVPYLCASAENNAVSSYISYNEEYIDKGDCVFIGGKTFVVSYQEKDFYSNDSHNLVLYLKEEEKKTKLNQLYLATCVNKGLGYKYSWGDSISNRKIQKDKMQLPTKNNQPDYNTMETLISAVQKNVVKKVVEYIGKK